jgi:hypothetical protein
MAKGAWQRGKAPSAVFQTMCRSSSSSRVGLFRALLVLALLMACERGGVIGQPAFKVLRVGFVTVGRPPEALAAFLSAVSAINNDPSYYLGDDTFRVEPYYMTPLFPGDVFRLGAMRAVMRLGGQFNPFNETAGLTRVAPLQDGALDPDVDAIIVGGPSAGAIAMAPIAELLSKPTIGVVASGDDLSDKV